MTHYHAIHNVSGYLPQSDDTTSFATFEDAADALREDLGAEIDGEESDARARELEDAQSALDAARAAGAAAAGGSFLTYTSTHADSDHDIPTAWQVTACTEIECDAVED